MDKAFQDSVMEYLTSRRMSSLGNVAMHFDCSVSVMNSIVKILHHEKRLRFSQSRCSSSCSSCNGCPDEAVPGVLSEQTILISLEKKEEEL